MVAHMKMKNCSIIMVGDGHQFMLKYNMRQDITLQLLKIITTY